MTLLYIVVGLILVLVLLVVAAGFRDMVRYRRIRKM
jgi:hypothetical protein